MNVNLCKITVLNVQLIFFSHKPCINVLRYNIYHTRLLCLFGRLVVLTTWIF